MTDKTCAQCSSPFHAARSDARYCSKPCARRAYYENNRERELAGMKAWREENREHDRARWADYSERRWGADRAARQQALALRLAASDKVCTQCGELKDKTEFYSDPRRSDGRYAWCKACFKAHCREARDPEAERERGWRWYEERGGRELTAARVKAWREQHPERVAELTREYQSRRRSQAVGHVDYAEILAEHGLVCHICGSEIDGLGDLHFDHVVPLSKGGPHAAGNIRPAHAQCNLRKGARVEVVAGGRS